MESKPLTCPTPVKVILRRRLSVSGRMSLESFQVTFLSWPAVRVPVCVCGKSWNILSSTANTTLQTAEETQADNNSKYTDPSPGPSRFRVTTLTADPDIWFNQPDWNSTMKLLGPVENFWLLFSSSETLCFQWLAELWEGKKLQYQLYFHLPGEFLHSSLNKYNVQIETSSILNSVDGVTLSSSGNRETCPWRTNNRSLAFSWNTFAPLCSFIIPRWRCQDFQSSALLILDFGCITQAAPSPDNPRPAPAHILPDSDRGPDTGASSQLLAGGLRRVAFLQMKSFSALKICSAVGAEHISISPQAKMFGQL